MKKRVGIIISGGDCPGLNTVLDAIVKNLSDEYEVLGFMKGFEGLLTNEYIVLEKAFTSPNRWIGGTYLKSVNKGNFPGKVGRGEATKAEEAVITKAYEHYTQLGLEGIIVLGGDGTLSMANNLQEYGFNVVGVPKSIDNDLMHTDFTFGFHTAVEVANDALDRLHTTTTSHERVMILEVMGRNAGWIGLYSGIAGGANVVLIPEIPFSFANVLDFLNARIERGRKSSIVVVAEGAIPRDGDVSTKNLGGTSSEILLGGIGDQLARYLNTHSTIEARSNSLGHVQRGGSPNSFDRILSTLLGAGAANLFRDKQYGYMVSYQNNAITSVPISDAVQKLKLVDPQSQLVQLARSVGIGFGDM
jgi:6-phosphofructokinase 1